MDKDSEDKSVPSNQEVGVKVFHQSLEYLRDITYSLNEQATKLRVLRDNLIGSVPQDISDKVENTPEPQNWSEALTLQIKRMEGAVREVRYLIDSFDNHI